MVAITFLTILVATGIRTVPPVLVHPLEQEFGWDRAAIASAVSFYLIFQAATTPVQGLLMDRFGPRRILLVSLPLMAAGVGATVVMREVWQFDLLWGVVVGVATGATTGVLSATVAGRWFTDKRGLVVGILSNASATGQLLFYPALMAVVLASGWRSASLLLAALVLLVVLPLAAVLMRDGPGQGGREKGRNSGSAEKRWGSAARQGQRPAGASRHSLLTPHHALASRPVFLTRDFWLLFGAMFACGATDAGLTGTHLVPYAIEQGVPEMAAASIIGVMGATNVVGSLASGWASDRLDPRLVLAFTFFSRVAALSLLPFMHDMAGLSAFALVFGLGWIAQGPPMTAIVVGRYGRERIGRVLGWTSPAHQLGAASMAYLAGAIRVWTGEYLLAFQLGTLLALLAGVAALSVARGGRARPAPAAADATV